MTSLDLRWLHLIMCDAEGIKVLLHNSHKQAPKTSFPLKLPSSCLPCLSPFSHPHLFHTVFIPFIYVCVSVDGSVSNGIEKIMLGPLL